MLETIRDFFENICETVQDFFEEDVTFTRKAILTTTLLCTFTGIIAGFILSPIKKGIYFNISNNGNNYPEDEE